MRPSSVIVVTLALGLASVARGQATAAPPELRDPAAPYNLVDAATKGYVSVRYHLLPPTDTNRVRLEIARLPAAGPSGSLYFFLPAAVVLEPHLRPEKFILDGSLDLPHAPRASPAPPPITLGDAPAELDISAYSASIDDTPLPPSTPLELLTEWDNSCLLIIGAASGTSHAVLQVAVWQLGPPKAPSLKDVSRRLPIDAEGWKAAIDLVDTCADRGLALNKDAGIVPPQLVHSTDPKYSEEARQAKAQGTILLNVVVGKDGLVKSATVIKGIGYGLDDAAVAAMLKWRFRPATYLGKPIQMQIDADVEFRLR